MTSDQIANYLESHGWKASVAGARDFAAAVEAMEQMIATERGIIISGEYGVGKSALAAVLAPAFGSVFKVRLAIPGDLQRLTPEWQDYNALNAFALNVWLDDLGAESPVNEFGVRRDPAGEFIVQYHELHRPGTRLIATTNFKTGEMDGRYGGRALSRLKDLCVPLRLCGPDKRTWIRGGAK